MALKCFSAAFHSGALFLRCLRPAAMDPADPRMNDRLAMPARVQPKSLASLLGKELRPRRPSPGTSADQSKGPDELTRRRSNAMMSDGRPPGAEVFHVASRHHACIRRVAAIPTAMTLTARDPESRIFTGSSSKQG
jgi:hypothetical protein